MKFNTKISRTGIVVALAIVVVVSASLFVSHTATPPKNPAAIRVGVIVPLTGQYAALGESDRNAMLMAQKELGAAKTGAGADIQLFFEDDAYDAKNAVTAYKKLKSIDDIDAVVLMSAPSIQAVAPLTNADHIPLLGLGGTNVYEKDSVFQLMPASNLLFSKLGEIYGEKYKRIAIAHSNATLFQDNTNKFLSGLPSSVHTDDFILPRSGDYRTDVQKILATHPQAVTTFMPKEDAIRFLQALRVQDRTGAVKIVCDFGTELAAAEYTAAIGGDRLEGCISTNLADTAKAEFKADYAARYDGAIPQITADYAYDSVGLIQALAAQYPKDTWVQALATKGFVYEGKASGHTEFNTDGTRLDMPPEIDIYRGGKFIVQ